MNARHDPPRLRTMMGDLPSGLSAALAEAGDDFPRPDQLEDLARRMGPLLGAASVAAAIPVATMAPKAPLTASAALKLAALKWSHIVVLPLAIGAASGAAVWNAAQPSEELSSAPPAIETRSLASTSGATPHRSPTLASTNAIGDAPSPSQDEALAAPKISTAPVSRAERAERRTGVRAPEPIATEAPGAKASEIELIDRAHRALSQAPSETRRWAAEHERLYPGGTFVQERETLIIEALAREGRTAEARARANLFLSRFPGSTYAQRIESVLRAATETLAPAK